MSEEEEGYEEGGVRKEEEGGRKGRGGRGRIGGV